MAWRISDRLDGRKSGRLAQRVCCRLASGSLGGRASPPRRAPGRRPPFSSGGKTDPRSARVRRTGPRGLDRSRGSTKGATVITGISERDELARVLLESPGLPTPAGAAPLDADLVADFFALGACRLQLELLTRRMHHYSATDDAQLRRAAISAAEATIAGDVAAAKAGLQSGFEALTEMRERFYPVECYLLDLCLLIPRLAVPVSPRRWPIPGRSASCRRPPILNDCCARSRN